MELKTYKIADIGKVVGGGLHLRQNHRFGVVTFHGFRQKI